MLFLANSLTLWRTINYNLNQLPTFYWCVVFSITCGLIWLYLNMLNQSPVHIVTQYLCSLCYVLNYVYVYVYELYWWVLVSIFEHFSFIAVNWPRNSLHDYCSRNFPRILFMIIWWASPTYLYSSYFVSATRKYSGTIFKKLFICISVLITMTMTIAYVAIKISRNFPRISIFNYFPIYILSKGGILRDSTIGPFSSVHLYYRHCYSYLINIELYKCIT